MEAERQLWRHTCSRGGVPRTNHRPHPRSSTRTPPLARRPVTSPITELTAWIAGVVSHAVVHEGIAKRRDDVESGALADELVWLLVQYLKRPK
jgi:hypothetical protein